ncbi:hypothetical protein Dimus_020953 [Dionaea muscipula]
MSVCDEPLTLTKGRNWCFLGYLPREEMISPVPLSDHCLWLRKSIKLLKFLILGNTVSQERTCDAHVGEEQDRQNIVDLRLKRKFKKLKIDDNEYHKVSMSAINRMVEELVNIKANVDMLTRDNVDLEKWNSELTKRNANLTCDLKSTSDECDVLKRRLKDMEEENARLRVEMKAERDEANIKAHQIVERLTEEMHKQCEVQIEKLVTENTALKIAHRVAECRQTLERVGNLNHVEWNPEVDYEPEPPPLIIIDPIWWNTDGPSNPLVYVKK